MKTLSALAAFGLPFLAVWWGTRRFVKAPVLLRARCVIVPIVLLVIGPSLFWSIASPLEEGDWRCLVCGAIEHRMTYRAWVLRGGPIAEVSDSHDTRPFEAWYATAIGVAHEHDWRPVGCHWHVAVDMVGCYIFTGEIYYRALPILPDATIAASMVDHVLRATTSERIRMIDTLRPDFQDDVFASIAKGKRMTREEFDRAYAAWLDEHPDWR